MLAGGFAGGDGMCKESLGFSIYKKVVEKSAV